MKNITSRENFLSRIFLGINHASIVKASVSAAAFLLVRKGKISRFEPRKINVALPTGFFYVIAKESTDNDDDGGGGGEENYSGMRKDKNKRRDGEESY